jgi:hypothetical protein
MRDSLLATLGRPEWWVIALAAFLVRGGFILVLLPLISLPSVAAIATLVAPTIEALVIGGETLEGALIGAIGIVVVLSALAVLGLAGAWLDLALTRAAANDDELELAWRPVRGSIRQAFVLRLTAHLPTALALAYAAIRIVAVTYDELISPGDATVPLVARVIDRAPDAVILVVLAWLIGETVGALAVRRGSMGLATGPALLASIRQLVSRRGLATFALTSTALLGVGVPFALALGRTWEHLRTYLLEQVPTTPLAAATVLLVGTWILGLSVLGAGLAWRSTAWTAEVAPN